MQDSLRSYTRLLGKYLLPFRWRMVLLSALLLASIGLQLVSPQVVRRFIDLTQQQGALDMLLGAALVYLGAGVGVQVVQVLATYLGNDLGWRATNALRSDLAEHCLSLAMSFHKRFSPGKLIERVDGDVLAMANFFSQFVIQILGSILLLVGILIALFLEDWRIGLGLSVYSAFVLGTLNHLRGSAISESEIEREVSAKLYGFVEERLTSRDDIRANGAGEYTMRRFHLTLRDYTKRSLLAWFKRAMIWVAAMSLFYVGRVIAFGLGAILYLAGEMTIGGVYLLTYYMLMLFGPLENLVHQLQDMQRAVAGMQRVYELLNTHELTADGGSRELGQGALPVTFDDVSFVYDDGEERVLKDLSFQLGSGRSLGLLGRTGSGKTTLSRLLFRFYDPSHGRICLGDSELQQVTLRSLRGHVGMVTQEVQLFQASVRDNLTMFDAAIADEPIHAVIQELGLGEWFARLPDGLDTELAAGGGGLSGGEGQLLAFARVFLKNPGLVILDEPSASLDPATERLVERAMDRLLAGRTAIIIAHRLGTVQRVDDIMIMDSGRIVEHGVRAQLASDATSRFSALLRTGLEESIA
jgi:ABC-type multidrug transport system fused ATPase/permease subunit